jgi:hypothetical protein
MWWRVLAVAVVLLCAGVAGGYAVADRSADQPASSDPAQPVPATSPSVPTPPVRTILPNPETDPLAPDLPASPMDLRPTPRAAGVRVDIPDGWRVEPIADSTMWSSVKEGNPKNTYTLRISLVRAQNVSVTAAKTSRIATLEEADSNGGIEDFEVTDETDDTFEATYVDGGYLRVTMETFVSFDGSHAYAGAAVTGRAEDREGLRDLLARTIESMQELPAKQRTDEKVEAP